VPLVPWEKGVLAGSHFVNDPEVSGEAASVTFGYGGAANAYAYVQHERTDFAHPRGGQAKYLSTVIEQHMSDMGERLAAHARRRL
jgi:hypothetical protein